MLGLRLTFWRAASNSGCLQVLFPSSNVPRVLSPLLTSRDSARWVSDLQLVLRSRTVMEKLREEKQFGWWMPMSCAVAVRIIIWLHHGFPAHPSFTSSSGAGGPDLEIFKFFFPHWALPFGLFTVIPGIRWGTIAQGSEADCSPACFSIALHLVLSFLPGPSGCIMVPTCISQVPWTDKQGKGWDGLAQGTETNIPSCTAYTNNMCFVLMGHSLPRYPRSFAICVSSVTLSCRKDCSQYSAKE